MTPCGPKGFEYQKLIDQFGVTSIDASICERFERVTNHKIHPWIARGMVFAHRELDLILDDYEAKKPIFIYTGRGPSSDSLHMGHLVPLVLTKWLQDVFNAIVIVQIADDEKFYFKDQEFDKIYNLGFENAKDIIACGFNPDKTFIFSNRNYSVELGPHKIIHDIFKHVNINTLQSAFGLKSNDSIGQYVWPIYQSAASFSEFYPSIFKEKTRCLVVYAIDQDPYFRIARDIANKLGFYKPCTLIAQFLPALEGNAKMSSSHLNTRAIFLNFEENQVKTIIYKHAFTGGRTSKAEHIRLGADLSVDIPIQWLQYFEYDDNIFNNICQEYKVGKLMTIEVKNILINKINEIINNHKEKRAMINQEILQYFYNKDKF